MRAVKIQKILNSIILASDRGVPVDKEKLIGVLGVEGVARRTANEYINSLLMAGKIKEESDGLWAVELRQKSE